MTDSTIDNSARTSKAVQKELRSRLVGSFPCAQFAIHVIIRVSLRIWDPRSATPEHPLPSLTSCPEPALDMPPHLTPPPGSARFLDTDRAASRAPATATRSHHFFLASQLQYLES
nr:unnamed protein product [Digitaria exilis]